jgi:hypothetical protein
MQLGRSEWGAAAITAILALLSGAPLHAADGVRPVAEELGERTKPTQSEGASTGLSDSAVRVLMTYALTIIPNETKEPDGKTVKIDKSDPNKFLIPTEDARRVIRAATRSAYAEVCDLKDLERANYETLIRGEVAKGNWSPDQMQLINALHMFSVSYFTGSVAITTKEVPDDAAPAPAGKPAAGDDSTAQTIKPPRPECSEDQKAKVAAAIKAYVQSAEAPAAKAAPQSPVAGGPN